MSGSENEISVLGKKSIVIYFSRADENYVVGNIDKGNTEIIAEYIRDITSADLFKVERAKPYPENYKECCKETLMEKNNYERPELVRTLDNIDEYEVVYIGYPIYWSSLPMPMFTQLENLNWKGKIVKFFSTHEGSGLGESEEEIRRVCEGATILDGISIRGSLAKDSKQQIEEWIK